MVRCHSNETGQNIKLDSGISQWAGNSGWDWMQFIGCRRIVESRSFDSSSTHVKTPLLNSNPLSPATRITASLK